MFAVLFPTLLFIGLFIRSLYIQTGLWFNKVIFPVRIKDSFGGANTAGDVS
jgi:hypothetical protein